MPSPRAVVLVAAVFAGCLSPVGVDTASFAGDAPATGAPHAPGWPSAKDAVLHPGVKVGKGGAVFGHFCTANFVFASADNRTLYLGLASHCVGGLRVGDRIPLASGAAVATLAYCSYGAIAGTDDCPEIDREEDERGWNDFALVEIAPEDRGRVHPALPKYGGPTGVSPPLAPGDKVRTYGNSDGRDLGRPLPDALDAREGVVTARSAWVTEVAVAGPGIPGDSGSPVVAADGGAVGVMNTLEGTNGVTNLDAALAFLAERTGLDVTLQTWPSAA